MRLVQRGTNITFKCMEYHETLRLFDSAGGESPFVDQNTQLNIEDCSLIVAPEELAANVKAGHKWADDLYFGEPSRGVISLKNSRLMLPAEVC